jgi:uncharacterized protein (DUF1684 family)
LYDYRRRFARLYQEREQALRAGEEPEAVLQHFRQAKDALFAGHPQSALEAEQRRTFTGLDYFPYDAVLCVEAQLVPLASTEQPTLEASGPHAMGFERAARLSFTLEGRPLELMVYWIDVYGGGLFLPFRDSTCGVESYGGGRYLFDTVKGSDFLPLERLKAPSGPADANAGYAGGGYAGGVQGYVGRIVLDFNYAYNPSCAYDPRWVCPLAPSENRLPLPIRAGERAFHP